MNKTMNIYANKGDKVIFANPTNGYESQQEHAKKHLVTGATYTIEKTVVSEWSTAVFLQEVPGVAFNSVLFEDHPTAPKNGFIPPKSTHRITRIGNNLNRNHPNIALSVVYEGELLKEPKVGESIVLNINSKDGKRPQIDESVFFSTCVEKIEGNNYHTKNSTYKIEKI